MGFPFIIEKVKEKLPQLEPPANRRPLRLSSDQAMKYLCSTANKSVLFPKYPVFLYRDWVPVDVNDDNLRIATQRDRTLATITNDKIVALSLYSILENRIQIWFYGKDYKDFVYHIQFVVKEHIQDGRSGSVVLLLCFEETLDRQSTVQDLEPVLGPRKLDGPFVEDFGAAFVSPGSGNSKM